MLKGKVKEYFIIYGGNSGLTEEFIYGNQPTSNENAVKVYSSSTQENTSLKSIDSSSLIVKDNKEYKVKKHSGAGIIIARNGKAGSMFYVNEQSFTMNDHAYIMQVKTEFQDKINIKYMLYTGKNGIENCVTSDKGGNRTFNKTLYEESYVSIPDISEQNEIIKEYQEYVSIKNNLEKNVKYIDNVLKKIPNYKHGCMYKVNKVFDIISEDRKLTEEYIYNNQGIFPVYSAKIDGAYGHINSSTFYKEILLVVQYGDAGKTMLKSGKLNVGRNVCGLIPNKQFEEKINLRFAKYALESAFINNSKGTNLKSLSLSTINSTEFFLPDYNSQIKIANEYEHLEKLKLKLENILKMVSRVLK